MKIKKQCAIRRARVTCISSSKRIIYGGRTWELASLHSVVSLRFQADPACPCSKSEGLLVSAGGGTSFFLAFGSSSELAALSGPCNGSKAQGALRITPHDCPFHGAGKCLHQARQIKSRASTQGKLLGSFTPLQACSCQCKARTSRNCKLRWRLRFKQPDPRESRGQVSSG